MIHPETRNQSTFPSGDISNDDRNINGTSSTILEQARLARELSDSKMDDIIAYENNNIINELSVELHDELLSDSDSSTERSFSIDDDDETMNDFENTDHESAFNHLSTDPEGDCHPEE